MKMIEVNFIKSNGDVFTIKASAGTTLLQAAESNNIGLNGPCSGNLACGRCHIIVDKEWLEKLPKPNEEEEDLLDILWDTKPNSRLACQIKLTEELDGVSVHIPS